MPKTTGRGRIELLCAVLLSVCALRCGRSDEARSTSAIAVPEPSGSGDQATQATQRGASRGEIDTRAASTPNDGGAAGSDASIPCDVANILGVHCQPCHATEPRFGAPISLTSLSDLRADDRGSPVYELANARIHATDETKMPPASMAALSADDLMTLGNWLQASAPAGAGCADDVGATDAAMPPASGSSGGSGGAQSTPIEYDDPELKCYRFTAFASPLDKSVPYSVPTTPDYYVAFTTNAPWEGTQYIRSFRAVIDDARVLHHWLLFEMPAGGEEGVQEDALGAHPEGTMINGWAPGGSDTYFDPDVAMQAGQRYLLQLHYNNNTGAPVDDASGVEVCVTPQVPTHVAGLSWLGTDAIAGTSAMGVCTPMTDQDIHLIYAEPHMHLKGTHMKVVLDRADGTEEVIHDMPFDFQYQHSYIMDVAIHPGDSLTTTCTYSEFAVFGPGSNDEMCYFFSIYWPAGALRSDGLGTALHGVDSCIDL